MAKISWQDSRFFSRVADTVRDRGADRLRILGSLLLLAIISALVLVAVNGGDNMQQDPATVSRDRISAANFESKSSTADSAKLSHPEQASTHQRDQIVVRPADSSSIPVAELNALLQRKPILDYEIVEINSNLLRERIRRKGAESFASIDLLGQTVTLMTENGTEYVQGPKNGYAVWHGKIKNTVWSYASLRINPSGQVSGEIQGPGIGYVTIESLGESSVHVVWSMDDTEIEQDME